QEHVLKAQIAHAIVCGSETPLSDFPPWVDQVFLALIPVNPQPSAHRAEDELVSFRISQVSLTLFWKLPEFNQKGMKF
ncbi:hypothetical protein H8959_002004, partial [Pygathrix nigripes]